MHGILSRIVEDSKAGLAERKRTRTIAAIRALLPVRTHDRFRDMFSGTDIVLIAEVKKASPSKGVFSDTFDPAAIARAYSDAGADAVSVLTEENHFLGGMDHLTAVRSAVALPILRKDFIIDDYQIYEACAAGADSFLLIAAILDDAALTRFIALGRELAMTPLVEIHTERELDRALAADALIIGINNRDLTDFRTTLATTTTLAPKVPSGRCIVSESGIASYDDVTRVRAAGVHGVLVGETLMRSSDVKAKIWELKGRK
ncbi:MAG: indole-3-glycerol phosphate synthase TrpC [Spirochaetota bacterium]